MTTVNHCIFGAGLLILSCFLPLSAVAREDVPVDDGYETVAEIPYRDSQEERGIDGKQPIIDQLAPLFHVRADAPPLLLITGDRELEMLGRYEENASLWRMMQVVEHPDTTLHELDGFNHGQMAEPAFPLLLRFMQKHSQ